jgi:hypothetical protein
LHEAVIEWSRWQAIVTNNEFTDPD